MSPCKPITVLLSLVLFCVAINAQQPQTSPAPQPEGMTTSIEAKTGSAATPARSDDRLPFMSETPKENDESAPSTGGLMLRTLGALLLIVGLIIAAAWGMKRFGGARFGQASEDAPRLSVLNSVGLGDKRSLAVVRFGERTLLIGSTSHSISLIAEAPVESIVTEAQSVAEMLAADADASFAEALYTAENGGYVEQW